MLQQQFHSSNQEALFSALLSRVSKHQKLLKKYEGIDTPAYNIEELPALFSKFNRLGGEDQLKKFENFCERATAIERLYEIGIRPDDGLGVYLKNYLSHRGLIFKSDTDIIELLDDDMIVEIYGPDFTQVFRTPNMLKNVSYSLMALETYEWWELFHRSEWVNQKIAQVAGEIFQGRVDKPIINPVEEHTVKELLSDKPNSVRFRSIVYAPIFDEKNELFSGLVHFVKVSKRQSLEFEVLH